MILKREQRQRRVVLRLADDVFIVVGIDAVNRRHVERARQIINHRVEQRLHALVLERGAAQHGKKRAGDYGLTDELFDRGLVGHLALEVGCGCLIVELARSLNHLVAVFLGLIEHVGRNVDVLVLGAEGFVVPHHALHAHQVDQAFVGLLGADRQLDRHRLGAEARLDVFNAFEEVGADLVHLVGEDDARNLVLVALAPDRLGLRLDALVGVEHDDGAVEHAQRTLYLDGEVDVAGRVDDVEALFIPERGGRGRRNGDAALLLLLHPIHRRGAFVHLADLMALAGIIEDPLGRRRLPGIDVRHDAEIAVVLDWVVTGHRGSVP